MVVLIDTYPIRYLYRFLASVDSRARITFLICIIPKRLISWELQVELVSLHFGFLQTKEVCIQLGE